MHLKSAKKKKQSYATVTLDSLLGTSNKRSTLLNAPRPDMFVGRQRDSVSDVMNFDIYTELAKMDVGVSSVPTDSQLPGLLMKLLEKSGHGVGKERRYLNDLLTLNASIDYMAKTVPPRVIRDLREKLVLGMTSEQLVLIIKRYTLDSDLQVYKTIDMYTYIYETETIINDTCAILMSPYSDSKLRRLREYILTGGMRVLCALKENYKFILFTSVIGSLVYFLNLLMLPSLTYHALLIGLNSIGLSVVSGFIVDILAPVLVSTVWGAVYSIGIQSVLKGMETSAPLKRGLNTVIPFSIVKKALSMFGLHDFHDVLTPRVLIEILITRIPSWYTASLFYAQGDHINFIVSSGLAGFVVSQTIYGVSVGAYKAISGAVDVTKVCYGLITNYESTMNRLLTKPDPETSLIDTATETINSYDMSGEIMIDNDYFYTTHANKNQPAMQAMRISTSTIITGAVITTMTAMSFMITPGSIVAVLEYMQLPKMVSNWLSKFELRGIIQRSLLGMLLNRIPGYQQFMTVMSDYILRYTMGTTDDMYKMYTNYTKNRPITQYALSLIFGDINSHDELKLMSVYDITNVLNRLNVNTSRFPVNWQLNYRQNRRLANDIQRIILNKQRDKVQHFRGIIHGTLRNIGTQLVTISLQQSITSWTTASPVVPVAQPPQESTVAQPPLDEPVAQPVAPVPVQEPVQVYSLYDYLIARTVDYVIPAYMREPVAAVQPTVPVNEPVIAPVNKPDIPVTLSDYSIGAVNNIGFGTGILDTVFSNAMNAIFAIRVDADNVPASVSVDAASGVISDADTVISTVPVHTEYIQDEVNQARDRLSTLSGVFGGLTGADAVQSNFIVKTGLAFIYNTLYDTRVETIHGVQDYINQAPLPTIDIPVSDVPEAGATPDEIDAVNSAYKSAYGTDYEPVAPLAVPDRLEDVLYDIETMQRWLYSGTSITQPPVIENTQFQPPPQQPPTIDMLLQRHDKPIYKAPALSGFDKHLFSIHAQATRDTMTFVSTPTEQLGVLETFKQRVQNDAPSEPNVGDKLSKDVVTPVHTIEESLVYKPPPPKTDHGISLADPVSVSAPPENKLENNVIQERPVIVLDRKTVSKLLATKPIEEQQKPVLPEPVLKQHPDTRQKPTKTAIPTAFTMQDERTTQAEQVVQVEQVAKPQNDATTGVKRVPREVSIEMDNKLRDILKNVDITQLNKSFGNVAKQTLIAATDATLSIAVIVGNLYNGKGDYGYTPLVKMTEDSDLVKTVNKVTTAFDALQKGDLDALNIHLRPAEHAAIKREKLAWADWIKDIREEPLAPYIVEAGIQATNIGIGVTNAALSAVGLNTLDRLKMDDKVYLNDVIVDTIVQAYSEGYTAEEMSYLFLTTAAGIPMELVDTAIKTNRVISSEPVQNILQATSTIITHI